MNTSVYQGYLSSYYIFIRLNTTELFQTEFDLFAKKKH